MEQRRLARRDELPPTPPEELRDDIAVRQRGFERRAERRREESDEYHREPDLAELERDRQRGLVEVADLDLRGSEHERRRRHDRDRGDRTEREAEVHVRAVEEQIP